MEMHQVQYFLASAKHLNFTRAARECGVSSPSLLRAIKLLEFEFGGPLFNRKRRSTHLSKLGRIALPDLEQLIRELGIRFPRQRSHPSCCRFCCFAHKR
ncbi:MAG: LysR family transcriptional regulator [Proteobacteria bacterium]|nr:LysR family transcriptional regulator [Pseudomonadota bacterium]